MSPSKRLRTWLIHIPELTNIRLKIFSNADCSLDWNSHSMLYGSGFQCKGRDAQRQCSLYGAQMRSANRPFVCRINNSSKCSNFYGPRAFGGPAVFCKSGPMNWNVQPLKRHLRHSAADTFKVKGDKVVRIRQYSNTYKPNVPSNIETLKEIIKNPNTDSHRTI